jgi:hypothetical protein
MDGVLADLEAGMYEDLGYSSEVPRAALFKFFLPEYVDLDGFAHSPIMPGAWELVNELIAKHGLENLAILTSVGQFADTTVVGEQKMRWLATNIPILTKVPFCATISGRQKAQFARPGVTLIDDHLPNIEAFRAAGGIGVHYPGEWNA